ncbi:MAG TPA: hypothetical protein VLT82_02225 [Myxococcaceae bacterium]|nr:hypothetical protein [Myxococcaceae bacterium]
MRKVLQRCAVLGVLALAPCHALAAGGQEWSVVTGETVGGGATSVHVQAAWPGVSVSVLHGFRPGFDFGGVFTVNYNYEGDVRASFPGIKVQAYLKATLVKSPRYNLGLWFAPGMLTYFLGETYCNPIILGTHTVDGSFYTLGNVCSGLGGTQFGVAFPAGLVFGVSVLDNLHVALDLDLPLFVTFGDLGTLTVPILFGGGVEYFLDRSTAVTFNLRAGPMIFTKSGYGTDLTFQALLGLAYKFR